MGNFIRLLFCLFLLTHQSVVAQTDVLLQKLKNHPQRDLTRCRLLNSYIDQEFELEKWAAKNEEMLKISSENLKKSKLKKEIYAFAEYKARGYSNRGAYYAFKGNNDLALTNYRKALNLADKHFNYSVVSVASQNIGVVHEKLGRLDSTMIYLRKAWFAIDKTKNDNEKGLVLTDIAYTYKIIGDYKNAIDYNLKSLKFFLKCNDLEGTERCYFTMARIFQDQAENEKAIQYYLKCERISKQINNLERLTLIYDALSNCYLQLNQLDKATFYNNKSMKLSLKIDLPERIYFALITEGNILSKKNQNALNIYQKAYEITKNSNYIPGIIKSGVNISSIYLKDNQIEKANKYAEEALAHAIDFNGPQEIILVCEQLKAVYLKKKNYQKVIEIQDLISEKQAIINEDQNKNIALKREFEFQNTLKENKISQLDKDIRIKTLESTKKTTLLYLILTLFILIVIVSLFLFFRYKSIKQTQFLEKELANTQALLIEKQRATESEIKAIKSQMNPHFFYNALNSIQGFVLTGEKEKASESIGLFSELSRAVLESSRTNEISLHDEIELLDSYLKLECMRMPKIKYHIEFDPELRLHDIFLPPMILQPILENSVKHGLANKEEGGVIQLRFKIVHNALLVEIEDDGIGRQAAEKLNKLSRRKGSSFSSEANKNRIELLNESFQLNIQQEIIDKMDEEMHSIGTLVKITIPQYDN